MLTLSQTPCMYVGIRYNYGVRWLMLVNIGRVIHSLILAEHIRIDAGSLANAESHKGISGLGVTVRLPH